MNFKKPAVLLALLFFFFSQVPVSAEIKTSPYFVKNILVQNIYLYKNGYRVTYFGNGFKLKEVYIPMEWFTLTQGYKTDDGNRKAELFYGEGAEYPYMSVYWKEGKFHHVVLHARRNYNDPSWGARTPDADSSDKFRPDQDLVFNF